MPASSLSTKLEHEARSQLARLDETLFAEIERAPEIIGFRNKLSHEYVKINNSLVWGIIETELPSLIQRCRRLLSHRELGQP